MTVSSLIDKQIEAALDRGDVAAAALLAAQLEKPQAYRDAMIRVNAIVTNGMHRPPQETPVMAKAKAAEPFELQPSEPGKVPPGVVEELRRLRTAANEGATDFREAIKVQADKHKVKPAALRRYVIALASDLVDEARAEAQDLERLIDA